MTADLLRRAASLLRARAEAATPGVWASGLVGVYRPDGDYIARWDDASQTPTTGDRMHIAALHPAVALDFADLFDLIADGIDKRGVTARLTLAEKKALTTARTYLNEPTP